MEEGGDPLQEKEGRPSVYYDVMPYQGELPQDIPETLAEVFEEDTDPAHPTLERQASVEVLDTLSNLDDKERDSSTPDLTEALAKKDKKKKRQFRGVFHRHKNREKGNGLDNRLTESFPIVRSAPMLDSPNHLSLDTSWTQGQWNSLDPDSRNGSPHSSMASLLSVESDLKDLSDEEVVESLVHPPSKESFHALVQSTSQPEPEGNVMGYKVNMTLMSGHGLAIRDRTGTSDPYVKFKCPPFKYRSAVIHRNLNPEWNEHFAFRLAHLNTPMLVRVYDHDFGSLDDFMGGQTLDLSSYADGDQHIVELGLVDPLVKNENLGYIRVCVKIAAIMGEDGRDSRLSVPETQSHKKQKSSSSSSHVWKSVLTVTLLEANNLPAMDQNGLCDPYCKFKLGSQKYKSKIQSKTLDPKWMERFDLRMYDDCSTLHIEMWDKDFPQNDDFIGSCFVELTSLPRNVTHDFTLPLVDRGDEEVKEGESTLHFTLCVTGMKVEEDDQHHEPQDSEVVAHKYGLLHSLDLKAIKERNIGHLCIRIEKVDDLVPCNSYVLVELGNSCVKTRPIPKTGNPVWDQTFEFTVGDIHEELEIMVYKISSRGTEQLLGKVKVPLHRLKNGCQQFALKDKQCLARSRGILHIETELVYNPVRAMIRTVNPREVKLLEDEQRFKKKVLMDNIKRVTNLVRTIMATGEFLNSTWSWENKPLSAFSFLVFLMVTYFGELWMLFFALMVIFLYQYLAIFIRKEHVWQKKVSNSVHQVSNINRATSLDNPSHDDSDLSDHMEDRHSSLREKLRLFREILVLVQKYLGYVADAEEGLRNLLNWQVPFLCWMALLIFLGGTVLFYLIPIRYVVLAWGINKYTKRLRKPNFIPNNELLDFMSRCPNNHQLQQWQELPLAVYNKAALKGSPRPSDSKSKRGTRKTK